jgi:hypothetical protein
MELFDGVTYISKMSIIYQRSSESFLEPADVQVVQEQKIYSSTFDTLTFLSSCYNFLPLMLSHYAHFVSKYNILHTPAAMRSIIITQRYNCIVVH